MRRLLVPAMLLLAAVGSAGAMHAQQSGGHTATFDHKTGNEWWVEVIVTGSPARVEARDDNTGWTALELKSWGAWGKSFRIEPGHRVQFRASWSDGASIESCWFTHPAGEEQCATTPPPPPPPGNVTFRHGGGNEWWVEATVSPRPTAVQAMDTNGAWVSLQLKSWGEWAGSFRIEPGHLVKFRAQVDGTWHESCWFTHPAGAPQCSATPPPPPGEFAFKHGGGNEWWVEAAVSPRPAAVEAMDTGGAWVPLQLKSWGEWAASFRIEPGHEVKFRARAAEGAWQESCWFSHPAGGQRACDETSAVWPREGSYVRYRVDEGEHWPSGADWFELNVTLRYVDGAWQEEVEGWNYFELYGEDGWSTQDRVRYVAASRGPDYADAPADAERIDYSTKKRGQTVSAPALRWGGENDPDCPCGSWTLVAHDGTGLLLSARTVGRMSHDFRDVVDTDAPIARGDPAPTAPPAPAWPREGSYVTYAVHEWSEGEYEPHDLYYDATFRYVEGEWTLQCVGTRHDHATGSVEPYHVTSQWMPPFPPLAPTAISNGTEIQFERLTNCHTWHTSPYDETLVARSWLTAATNRSGSPFTARVWYADETSAQEAAGIDYDAWWDLDTRLVVRWEYLPDEPYGRSMGNMTDTDAPLRRA